MTTEPDKQQPERRAVTPQAEERNAAEVVIAVSSAVMATPTAINLGGKAIQLGKDKLGPKESAPPPPPNE